MADKMATAQHYNWLYLCILHFADWQPLRWPFLFYNLSFRKHTKASEFNIFSTFEIENVGQGYG